VKESNLWDNPIKMVHLDAEDINKGAKSYEDDSRLTGKIKLFYGELVATMHSAPGRLPCISHLHITATARWHHIQIYKAINLSLVLYGAEPWPLHTMGGTKIKGV
jgi:hypothetical protein